MVHGCDSRSPRPTRNLRSTRERRKHHTPGVVSTDTQRTHRQLRTGGVHLPSEPVVGAVGGAEGVQRGPEAPARTRQPEATGETITAVDHADVRLFLTSRPGIATTVVADITLLLADGTALAGQASGEAVASGVTWQLAGRFRLPGASGGFRATLDTLGTADGGDDRLLWQVDAIRP